MGDKNQEQVISAKAAHEMVNNPKAQKGDLLYVLEHVDSHNPDFRGVAEAACRKLVEMSAAGALSGLELSLIGVCSMDDNLKRRAFLLNRASVSA